MSKKGKFFQRGVLPARDDNERKKLVLIELTDSGRTEWFIQITGWTVNSSSPTPGSIPFWSNWTDRIGIVIDWRSNRPIRSVFKSMIYTKERQTRN